MVDTLMLSSVGDYAVGAVGTANSYIGMFIIMFSIISSGMMTVMTQNIGAGRPGIAYQARQLGLIFNSVIGMGMSIFLFIFSGNILDLIGIAGNLREPAMSYLEIVGGGCFLNALIPIFASYLRAFGHTKQPLIATIIGNLVNFALNAVFLFALHKGVQGVATATVISKVINLAIVIFFSCTLVKAGKNPERLSNRTVLSQIIRVGLPSAFESVLYNVAMMLVVKFLNQMDTDGINVTACKRDTKKAAIIGVIVATCLETLFAVTAPWAMKLFTDNPDMVHIVTRLLAIDIILEVGRVTNLVYGQALKTSGDAVFPAVIAAVFMYVCAVGGTWMFGLHLGLLATGAYIGLTCDECVRAVGMVLRWRSGKWTEKKLV